MQVVSFPAQPPRTHYRHELRTLTYVTLDEANGGIVRNLSHEGVAVQAVARLRQKQRVRLRFELRFPRLRVEAYGEVSWATSSGQCGIRFVELPPGTRGKIDEWIFSNLLDAAARDAAHARPIFGASVVNSEERTAGENDGLTLSAPPHLPITLDPMAALSRCEASIRSQRRVAQIAEEEEDFSGPTDNSSAPLKWLSRPLSGRTLAWTVDSLIMFAGLLLFALVFLSVTHELPQWPLTLCAALAAAVFVVAAYRVLFAVLGGTSLGSRLAHAASAMEEREKPATADRFR